MNRQWPVEAHSENAYRPMEHMKEKEIGKEMF